MNGLRDQTFCTLVPWQNMKSTGPTTLQGLMDQIMENHEWQNTREEEALDEKIKAWWAAQPDAVNSPIPEYYAQEIQPHITVQIVV
jgi:hypothetical protein